MLNETLMNSNEQDPNDDLNIKYKLNIIVPIIWSTIILLGILGNGTIIYIILKRRLYKDSCTNCYIINVAIADLCFTLICVPVTMTAYIYKEWIFGAFMCSFQNLLIFSSVQAACLTLTAMTVDRYLAVLYPFKSIEYRTTRLAFITNIVIWIASFTLNMPYYMYYKYSDGHYLDSDEMNSTNSTYSTNSTNATEQMAPIVINRYCTAQFPSVKMEIILTLYTVMMSYVLPLLTIIFCYLRMIIKIYSNSNDQKLVEDSKTFTSHNFGSAQRLNVNRQVRVSMENFCKGSPRISVPRLDNKRTHSMQEGTKLMMMIKTNGGNKLNASTNDFNQSMEDFLDDFEDLNHARKDQQLNENGSATAVEYDAYLKQQQPSHELYKFRIPSVRQSRNSHRSSNQSKSDLQSINEGQVMAKADSSRAKSTGSDESGENAKFIKRNSTCSTHRGTIANSRYVALKKQKLKILVLIATVSITFALTWLPAHVIQIWKVAFNDHFPYNDAMYIIKFIAHTLSYSNSFLNPFIYVFIGTRFRNHIQSEFSYLYGLFFQRNKNTPDFRAAKRTTHFSGSESSYSFRTPSNLNGQRICRSHSQNQKYSIPISLNSKNNVFYNADNVTSVGPLLNSEITGSKKLTTGL